MLHAERTPTFRAGHTPSSSQLGRPWLHQDGESAASLFWLRAFDFNLTQISPKPCYLVLEKLISALGRPQSTKWNVILSFLQIENAGNPWRQGSGSAKMSAGSDRPIPSHFSHSGYPYQRHSKKCSFFFLFSQQPDHQSHEYPPICTCKSTACKVRRAWNEPPTRTQILLHINTLKSGLFMCSAFKTARPEGTVF